MLKEIVSNPKFWSIFGTIGTVATVAGSLITMIAEPKNSEEEYRKIAKEEVNKALNASNKES